MPTQPEGALVRVRSKIGDMVEDGSPVLRKMDGKDGFFEKINRYAVITGVKSETSNQPMLRSPMLIQVACTLCKTGA